jgi:hypothetical protein
MSAWLGSLISALVASLAVIVTNLLNRRDARTQRQEDRDQRAADRDHAAAQAVDTEKRDRQRRMEDQWRDARLEAHLALLAAFDKGLDLLAPLIIESLVNDPASKPSTIEPSSFLLRAELSRELAAALARVEVIGSRASSAAGGAVVEQLRTFHVQLLHAESRNITYRDIRAGDEEIRRLYDSYVGMIRQDLGTSD